MKFKLYLSLDTEMLDAEEYHLERFPTLEDFLVLDNTILCRVSLIKLNDILPLVKKTMTQPNGDFKSNFYAKWKMSEDQLINMQAPVYMALRSI